MSVCVIVPTRGRPRAAAALAHEFYRTRTCDDTYLIFGVDDDDTTSDEYFSLLDAQPNVSLVVGPRLRMGPTLNSLAVQYAVLHDVIGFMGDDHRPRTIGWDTKISDVLSAAPGVAYGDDRIHGSNLPTAVFMSSMMIERLGYMAPRGLIHLYLDNFWLELGRATNLSYCPDLVFEHLHPIAGKAEWDPGYIECNSDEVTQHDALEFQRYMREEWNLERSRLS